MDPGFVLLGTCQQGVPVILRELVFPGGFDLVSPSFTVRDVTTELYTLDLCFVLPGTRQQGVPVILRELMFPDGFDPVSPRFTVRDVTSCKFSSLRNNPPQSICKIKSLPYSVCCTDAYCASKNALVCVSYSTCETIGTLNVYRSH
ncbi:unnamed protein product [Schistosoma curassoni]|uniref:Uncharacterized protein n=1 Tax=Schistosoma curassoni TaxID=6186 RepID=A0A3P8CVK7_9TREM|nr:unnamed protein product [Schistosoma curassoni]